MNIVVTPTEIVAFVSFIVLIAPTLIGVGYLIHQVWALIKWRDDHDERTLPLADKLIAMEAEFRVSRDQRDRIESKIDKLVSRLDGQVSLNTTRWGELDTKIAKLETKVARIEEILEAREVA